MPRRTRVVLRRVAIGLLTFLLMNALAGCGGSALDATYAVRANVAVEARDQAQAPGGAGSSRQSPDDTATTGSVTGSQPEPKTGSEAGGLAVPDPEGTPDTGGGHSSATGGSRAACAGFRNQTGITDKTITLANVADISGPVPGIFTSAQQAVRAYVEYFNATSRLCGRKLEVLTLDSRTDSVADQAAYLKACDEAFAAVGSMSAFDAGGAATAQSCGLPDVRALAVSDARNACRTCFGAQATDLHAFQNAVPDFFLAHYREATQHAAMIYVNAAASVQNARTQQAVEERRGMRFVYSSSFDVAEFNYSAYVQRMKEKGVRWVQFVGSSDQAVRLARAMQQASFKPDVFLLDPTAYDPIFAEAGSPVDGAFVFIDFTPFEEAGRSNELRLYQQWLRQVSPNAAPSYFGLFAWSAARLFVERATALGGDLSRARLVASLSRVDGWTSNGLHAPQDVGGKTNSSCWRFLRLQNGVWKPVGGTKYLCRGSTKADQRAD